jgi:D-aminopeptidase
MPRLRELGVAIGTLPTGPHNAITDVPGVRVGHTTLIRGDAVRTGVTAIHPHEGSAFTALVPAAVVVLNGAGELTGRSQIDEYGTMESPIVLTNTLSVGTAHRAVCEWISAREAVVDDFVIPVVAETCDGFLNDLVGQHVTGADVLAALDGATSGPVAEGNVGGGTGMGLFQFKGGIGTSSRVVAIGDAAYTVGVLVQGNFGRRQYLRIDGEPVGRGLTDQRMPLRGGPREPERDGSIIVVIATDAPLSDRQLARLARRGTLGIGRMGGIAAHSSGDLLLAFSNAPSVRVPRPTPKTREVPPLLVTPRLHDAKIDPLFEATIDATEEAIGNALVAATTMVGRGGNTLFAFPHDRIPRR